jgi:hypothetical protein
MGRGDESGRPVSSSRALRKKKCGLTGGAHRSALKPNRYGGGRLPQLDEYTASVTGRRAALGELTGGGGERLRGCRAAPEVLLGHLQQAARRGRLCSAGNGRCSAERSRSPSST